MPPKAAAKAPAKAGDKSPKGKDDVKKEASVGKKGADPKGDDAEKNKLLAESGLIEAYECSCVSHLRCYPESLQSRSAGGQHLRLRR